MPNDILTHAQIKDRLKKPHQIAALSLPEFECFINQAKKVPGFLTQLAKALAGDKCPFDQEKITALHAAVKERKAETDEHLTVGADFAQVVLSDPEQPQYTPQPYEIPRFLKGAPGAVKEKICKALITIGNLDLIALAYQCMESSGKNDLYMLKDYILKPLLETNSFNAAQVLTIIKPKDHILAVQILAESLNELEHSSEAELFRSANNTRKRVQRSAHGNNLTRKAPRSQGYGISPDAIPRGGRTVAPRLDP